MNRLVVASAEIVSDLPSWLLDEIRDERWLVLKRLILGELEAHEKVGDAEALAYFMTLSRRVILSSGYVNIFDYLMRKVLSRRHPGMPAVSFAHCSETLTAFEKRELEEIKTEICEQRGEMSHPIIELLEAVVARRS